LLEEHAEEPGVVERDRDLQIPVLVWALVFGFAAGESQTLTGFRRSHNPTTEGTIFVEPSCLKFINRLIVYPVGVICGFLHCPLVDTHYESENSSIPR